MPDRNEPLIDAPIPGMSMTHEVGARPWQQPAKYTTVEDASKYYITRMQDKQFTETLVNVLEMGVPITTLANTIQLSSVMQGLHSIDVGMLVLPVIMEIIKLVADSADIEYNTGLDEDDSVKIGSKTNDVDVTIGKLSDLVDEDESVDDLPMDAEETVVEEEPQMGLMARR
tara:strand:+ start:797 stop:1309 length:513 start_codon:yes stop_codon:yes gene_type:complete